MQHSFLLNPSLNDNTQMKKLRKYLSQIIWLDYKPEKKYSSDLLSNS